MSLRKTFKTDKSAETDGVWITVGLHNNKPQEIKISRMTRSNKRYQKALEEATRPHSSAIQNETLEEELGGKLLREVFADTIILDWRNVPKSELTGVEADDKVDLPFSRENVLALFEELPDLYDDWESKAKKSAAFREKEKEANAKN